MGLDEILAGIAAAEAAALTAIDADTSARLAEIEAPAAAAVAARREANAAGQLAAARVRQLSRRHQASLAAAGTVAAARDAALLAAWTAAGDRLAQSRSEPDYPALLHRLLSEALDAFGPGPAQVVVDPADLPLVQAWQTTLKRTVQVATEDNAWGGVRVCSPDERVEIDNRLAARWQRLRDLLPTLPDLEAIVAA